MSRTMHSRRRGFTRTDLAMLLTLIFFLFNLLTVSAQSKVRTAADRAMCQDQLHNIAVAILNHESVNIRLPPMLDRSPAGMPAYWMPFWYQLLSDLELPNLYRRTAQANGWDNGNHETAIKMLICPSDPTHDKGMVISGAKGWAGTSYAPVQPLFGQVSIFVPAKGVHITQARYSIANLPDGPANQIGVVERFTSFPLHGWSNATFYPMSQNNWGFNAYGSSYGSWGLYPPQTGATARGRSAGHPYYPTTAHTTLQVSLMDGSVRGISNSITRKTWEYACTPDDQNPLGGDW